MWARLNQQQDWHSTGLWAFTVRLILFLGAAGLISARGADESDYLFNNTNLIRIQIDIPETGVQALMLGRGNRAHAAATVTEGGGVYTNVVVHLKGRGTFQPIEARPSLTLIFDKGTQRQAFHGLRRISLNN